MNLKPQSIRSVFDRIENHILPYFKYYDIYELKEVDILEWHYYMQNKNLSYRYLKNIHTCLITFLNFAVKFYDLDKNVASKVGNFRYKGQKIKKFDFYTLEEFKRFINSKLTPANSPGICIWTIHIAFLS